MATPRKVAPRGFPRLRMVFGARSVERGSSVVEDSVEEEEWSEMEVLRRKSCVIAMPIEAKEREVRSQARNVRSSQTISTMSRPDCCSYVLEGGENRYCRTYQAPNDL